MQEQTDIRVFLADDHEITIRKLSEVINATPGMRVVGSAMDGSAVLKYFEHGNNNVDVALIDIGMPEMNGMRVTSRIKSVCKNTLKVILITGLDGVYFPAEAIRNHANGFITKSRHKDEITDAIRRVLAGELVYLPEPEDPELKIEEEPRPLISPVENRIVCLVVQGLTALEIAHETHIGVKYVEKLRNQAMHKLGAKNAAQLGMVVQKFGLCDKEIPINGANPV